MTTGVGAAELEAAGCCWRDWASPPPTSSAPGGLQRRRSPSTSRSCGRRSATAVARRTARTGTGSWSTGRSGASTGAATAGSVGSPEASNVQHQPRHGVLPYRQPYPRPSMDGWQTSHAGRHITEQGNGSTPGRLAEILGKCRENDGRICVIAFPPAVGAATNQSPIEESHLRAVALS